MRVIGTAGHVDHGKSALVEALTGIDPDRLKEEKDRQMTIDLGFAWMTLPSGDGLGIVDVPGHRDFIENMLAGVGGIDAALLVVAADEGVMPQTREHLAILELLEVDRLLVALTKADLQVEPGWTSLVEEEVAAALERTRFEGARIHRVSARTGQGLPELIEMLDKLLAEIPPRADQARPRLPVDRAFSISGFGTVVTGTLSDGQFRVGEEVELLPGGSTGRIRGLQTHKEVVEQAQPGSRVAMNLAGMSVDEIRRGDVIVHPGSDRSTTMLDARLRILEDSPLSVKHDVELKFFTGAAQRRARVRLLGAELIRPGETGWVQLILDDPIVIRRADHFIVRRPSPGATLGGGRIADPHPTRRHRRWDSKVLERLERRLSGSGEQILLATLDERREVSLPWAASAAGLTLEQAAEAVRELQAEDQVRILEPDLAPIEWKVISAAGWQWMCQRAVDAVERYHQQFPLRAGIPRQELRSRLGLEGGGVLQAMVRSGILEVAHARIRLPGWEVKLPAEDRARVESLMATFDASPYSPPSVKECIEMIGEELLVGLVEQGRLVRVSDAVVFEAEAYRQLVERVEDMIRSQGSVSVAELRNAFATSRKYALALLEQLDSIGLTYREGDVRKLVRS